MSNGKHHHHTLDLRSAAAAAGDGPNSPPSVRSLTELLLSYDQVLSDKIASLDPLVGKELRLRQNAEFFRRREHYDTRKHLLDVDRASSPANEASGHATTSSHAADPTATPFVKAALGIDAYMRQLRRIVSQAAGERERGEGSGGDAALNLLRNASFTAKSASDGAASVDGLPSNFSFTRGGAMSFSLRPSAAHALPSSAAAGAAPPLSQVMVDLHGATMMRSSVEATWRRTLRCMLAALEEQTQVSATERLDVPEPAAPLTSHPTEYSASSSSNSPASSFSRAAGDGNRPTGSHRSRGRRGGDSDGESPAVVGCLCHECVAMWVHELLCELDQQADEAACWSADTLGPARSVAAAPSRSGSAVSMRDLCEAEVSAEAAARRRQRNGRESPPRAADPTDWGDDGSRDTLIGPSMLPSFYDQLRRQQRRECQLRAQLGRGVADLNRWTAAQQIFAVAHEMATLQPLRIGDPATFVSELPSGWMDPVVYAVLQLHAQRALVAHELSVLASVVATEVSRIANLKTLVFLLNTWPWPPPAAALPAVVGASQGRPSATPKDARVSFVGS